jgi:DNA (cytosine-5)-methyltransferase 1
LIYGSVCSGIEAASVAWERLGWKCAFVSEIEPFPSAVLKYRFSEVPNLGDFTRIDEPAVDLLVGGTPCQDFSVAGLRAGLAGDRGQLTIEFVHLLERLRPRWMVWENVPGVLSSDGGRAFGAFLGLLGQRGYGFAYRILDAQFFGVPQRRRRVFVVGYFGDWRPAAAVLFERHSLSGDTPPRRKAGQVPTGTLGARASAGGGLGTDFECDGGQTAVAAGNQDRVNSITTHVGAGVDENMARDGWLVAPTLRTHRRNNSNPITEASELVSGFLMASGAGMERPAGIGSETDFLVAHSLSAEGFDASEDGTGPLLSDDLSLTRASRTNDQVLFTPAVAFTERGRADGRALETQEEVAYCLRNPGEGGGGSSRGSVSTASSVRRLTPTECERLQGFPDGWTAVPYRGKPASDGPRYRALGNSMAVPVMRWLGERIALVDLAIASGNEP